jgi:TonB-dependent SusC/RagA subfamily outer membrane receptor
LKDATAASIWGVRSGNGVIVISTKKGRLNQRMSVEFNSNVTIGQRPDLYYSPAFIKSSDFISLETDLFNKDFYSDDFMSEDHMPVSPVVEILAKRKANLITASDSASQIDAYKKLDVRNDQSKYLYRKSVIQQYSLNIKGGSNNSTYFLSLGYDKNLSNQSGNQNSRITINSLSTYTPIRNLEFSANVVYTRSNMDNNSPLPSFQVGGMNNSKGIYPYARLADANGNALPIVKDYRYGYIDTAGGGKLLDWRYRPLSELSNADNTVKAVDAKLVVGVKYSFLSYFSAELKYQFEQGNTDGRNYYSTDTYSARDLINKYSAINSGIVSRPIPLGAILDL